MLRYSPLPCTPANRPPRRGSYSSEAICPPSSAAPAPHRPPHAPPRRPARRRLRPACQPAPGAPGRPRRGRCARSEKDRLASTAPFVTPPHLPAQRRLRHLHREQREHFVRVEDIALHV